MSVFGDQLVAFARDLGTDTREHIQAKMLPLQLQLDALTARLDALEDKPFVKFRGVHDRETAYALGDAVVRQGALWISTLNSNHATPGESPVGWTLAVKRSQAQWAELDDRLRQLEGRR